MEEETEVLDWGNEDDELQHQRAVSDMGEEDAVSLGGEEDDVRYSYQAQEDHQGNRATTPKSATFTPQGKRELHRESSNGSLNQLSHSQNSQNNSNNSQNSQSSLRRTQSQSILTHALPPKPVLTVASTPLGKEASTLASSMAAGRERERRNGKSRPPSDGPLPEDWEARTPRSGGGEVYYYNVKTHESTWTRPRVVSGGRSSPSKDNERDKSQVRETRRGDTVPTTNSILARPGHSDTTDHQPASAVGNGLSYEDRHYRPTDATAETNGKPEERDTVEPTRPRRSRTRSPSPQKRHDRRDLVRQAQARHDQVDRVTRPRRGSSLQAMSSDRAWATPQRDAPRELPGELDRTWIPRGGMPPEPVQGPRRDRPPFRQRANSQISTRPAPFVQDRNTRNEAGWSSPRRHRSSSPPPLLEPSRAWTASQAAMAAESTLRPKSRFDRSAMPPADLNRQSALRRDHDVYVPAESLPQRRGREFELPPATIENEAKRRRIDERTLDSAQARRAPLASPPLPSPVLDRSARTPPLSFAGEGDQSRFRKRAPLPPQSERFRESSRHPHPPSAMEASSVPTSASALAAHTQASYAPTRPRDSGLGMQRPANSINIVPSGPRHQYPPPPVRDSSHPDFAQGSRPPPSGPAATARGRTRFGERLPSFSDLTISRETDAMDVDPVPPSRVPVPRTHQPPARSSLGGMYADREPPLQDSLPRGPRAMAGRTTTGGPYASPSTPSSTTPLYSHRPSYVSQDYFVPRGKERSPPPHMASGDGWAPRASEGLSRSPSFSRRPEPVREPLRDDMPSKQPVTELRRQVSRQDMPFSQPHRPSDVAPRGGPGPKLSGTNNIPIGGKRPQHPEPEPPSPYAVSGAPYHRANRDFEIRTLEDTRGKLAYERVTPVEDYVPPRRDTRSRSYSDARPSDVPVIRRPVPSVSTSTSSGASVARRDGYYADDPPPRPTRFGPQRPPVEAPPVAQRAWAQREPAPTRVIYEREPEFRPTTPPRPARGPSSTPSSWPPLHYVEPPRLRYKDNVPPPEYPEPPYPPPSEDRPSRGGGGRSACPPPEHDQDLYDAPESHYSTRSTSVDSPSRLDSQYPDRYGSATRYPLAHDGPARPPPRGGREREPYSVSRTPSITIAETGRGGGGGGVAERRQPASWDRSPERGLSPSPTKVHPDRARLLHDPVVPPPPPPVVVAEPEPSAPVRMSKPVRIRRPTMQKQQPPVVAVEVVDDRVDAGRAEMMMMGNGVRERERERERDLPPHREDVRDRDRDGHRDSHRREFVERPGMGSRRGGSLLDRLSAAPAAASSSSAGAGPSLRERVQAGEVGDMSASQDEGAEGGGGEVKRSKRRSGRGRRGRRGGMA